MSVYDRIGTTYGAHRRADPRIAAGVLEALDRGPAGPSGRVLNVGAGAGSYEPADRPVVAVEPSPVMIAQRPAGVPCVRAVAEHLPFDDGAFDAGLAVLTIHHWPEWQAGLAELVRVAPTHQVLMSWHAAAIDRFWLIQEYLPGAVTADASVDVPDADDLAEALGGATLQPVPVPADCTDGFFAAYWRRPEAYLDPSVRADISVFALGLIDPAELADGLGRLAADLDSGAWSRRHADLLELDELDVGYRLVVSSG